MAEVNMKEVDKPVVPRVCWSCGTQSQVCLPAIGGLWICVDCDNQIVRVSGVKVGKALAEYAQWMKEHK